MNSQYIIDERLTKPNTVYLNYDQKQSISPVTQSNSRVIYTSKSRPFRNDFTPPIPKKHTYNDFHDRVQNLYIYQDDFNNQNNNTINEEDIDYNESSMFDFDPKLTQDTVNTALDKYYNGVNL